MCSSLEESLFAHHIHVLLVFWPAVRAKTNVAAACVWRKVALSPGDAADAVELNGLDNDDAEDELEPLDLTSAGEVVRRQLRVVGKGVLQLPCLPCEAPLIQRVSQVTTGTFSSAELTAEVAPFALVNLLRSGAPLRRLLSSALSSTWRISQRNCQFAAIHPQSVKRHCRSRRASPLTQVACSPLRSAWFGLVLLQL